MYKIVLVFIRFLSFHMSLTKFLSVMPLNSIFPYILWFLIMWLLNTMLSFMNLYVELQLTETYNYCSSNHKFPAKIKGNRGGKKKKKKNLWASFTIIWRSQYLQDALNDSNTFLEWFRKHNIWKGINSCLAVGPIKQCWNILTSKNPNISIPKDKVYWQLSGAGEKVEWRVIV